MKRLLVVFFLFCVMLVLNACESLGSPSGGFGATPGGVQDMGTARELIKNGLVPPAEAFVVEGMFSEHDLPLEGAACDKLLCLRGALGIAPTFAGEASAWYQVGLSSSVNPDEIQRPALSLILVVDISGSMSAEYQTVYNEYQTPLSVAKTFMEKLLPSLNENDEIAIVTYGRQAQVALAFTSGNQQDKLKTTIKNLSSEGSTNMEAGLTTAYRLLKNAQNAEVSRLILFTDVQPNVGATSATEFEQIVEAGALTGAGLTVMGVGVGLGPATFDAMSKVRGGNAYTLFGSQEINKVLSEDWPYLASPVAYDLNIKLEPTAGIKVVEGYGFPTSDEQAELEASTVFLSKRKGALLICLKGESFANLALKADLSYETTEGQIIKESLNSSYDGSPLDSNGQYFEQTSVAKTVALALLVSDMRKAAEVYVQDQEQALGLVTKASQAFEKSIANLNDDALKVELELSKALLKLMQEGAEQGTLYGR